MGNGSVSSNCESVVVINEELEQVKDSGKAQEVPVDPLDSFATESCHSWEY